jgi:RNA-binding protein YhbY
MVKPIKRIQLGKKGLTEEFVMQLKKIFESERIVKVVVLKSACRDKDELNTISKELINSLGNKYKIRTIGYVLTIMKFRKDMTS